MYPEATYEKKGMRMRGGIITFFAMAFVWQILWPVIYYSIIPDIEGYYLNFDFFEFAFGNPQYLFWLIIPLFIIIHASFLHRVIPSKVTYSIVTMLLLTGYVLNAVEYGYFLFPSEMYWTCGIITVPLFLLSIIFVLVGRGGKGFVVSAYTISFVLFGIYFFARMANNMFGYGFGSIRSDEAEFLYVIASLPVQELTFLIGMFILGLSSCPSGDPVPSAPAYSTPTYSVPPYTPQTYDLPQYNQPPYEQPQYNPPQYNQPPYEQPQYNPPQYNQPQYNPQAYDPQSSNTPNGNGSRLIDSNNLR
ncbi:MAG: hypothetical protein IKB50_00455 [Clostridia bacterium]|nr:hypothetical protein [Clostridia bacterium]